MKALLALTGLLGLMTVTAAHAAGQSPAQQPAATAPAPAEAKNEPAGKTKPGSVQQHVQQGMDYLGKWHFKEAIAEFDAAIALDPKNPEPYVRKGMALYRNDKWKEALPLMDKAVQLSLGGDKSAAWWPLYEKGLAQRSGRDLEGAIESFSESIKFKPNDENYSARARAYLRQEKLEQALADVKAALRYKPDSHPLAVMAEHVESRLTTKKEADALLKEMASREGAQKMDSGLIYFELKKGDGKHPTPDDYVRVNYTGELPDGTVFDSSARRGHPAAGMLSRFIPCWVEGLQKMRVGGKARLICPGKLAFDNRGDGPAKPGTVLSYDVELLGIE